MGQLLPRLWALGAARLSAGAARRPPFRRRGGRRRSRAARVCGRERDGRRHRGRPPLRVGLKSARRARARTRQRSAFPFPSSRARRRSRRLAWPRSHAHRGALIVLQRFFVVVGGN